MSMLMSEFKTAIKEYINDTSATVDQVAADALRALSTFFWLEDEDKSLSANGSTTAFTRPTATLFIYGVKVGTDEYERITLDERERFDIAVDLGLYRFYETATQIIFPVAPSSGTITLHRRKAFAVPADGVALDVPDYLIPLAIAMACQRYFRKMVSRVATSRETLPDIKPDEIRAALKSWTDQVNEEIASIKSSNVMGL